MQVDALFKQYEIFDSSSAYFEQDRETLREPMTMTKIC
jgi:hypothetical protein